MDGPERRQQLDQLIDGRRRQLRLRWNQVVQRAGMSAQNLRLIRQGVIGVTVDAADRIEDALEWARGSITGFLDDGTPPQPRDEQPAVTAGGTDADLIFEGFRSLFRKHRMTMTPRHLRQFLADVDAELQARANTAGKSLTEDDGPFDPR